MSDHRIVAELLGHRFRFEAAPGLFSADRVDDGTKLLLANLPERAPASVLDLGCGYGALGLPVAAAHPSARCVLVDRDALAVEYSIRNAASHGLGNVVGIPSLGYRDIARERFDWVLCNVPARIGEDAIAYMVGVGAGLLTDHGELRIVVIQDLGPVVERIAGARKLPVKRVAEGSRHLVYACPRIEAETSDHESFYARDRVRVGGHEFERPHDINEDLPHLREGMPLLLDCLPRAWSGPALTWRAGYGPCPVELALRGAAVEALDRDLLALTFARRNASRLGTSLTTTPLAELVTEGPPTKLFAGELYANVGNERLAHELAASQQRLAKDGQAFWLGLTKVVKELAPEITKRRGFTVATRGAYSVVRLPAR